MDKTIYKDALGNEYQAIGTTTWSVAPGEYFVDSRGLMSDPNHPDAPLVVAAGKHPETQYHGYKKLVKLSKAKQRE